MPALKIFWFRHLGRIEVGQLVGKMWHFTQQPMNICFRILTNQRGEEASNSRWITTDFSFFFLPFSIIFPLHLSSFLCVDSAIMEQMLITPTFPSQGVPCFSFFSSVSISLSLLCFHSISRSKSANTTTYLTCFPEIAAVPVRKQSIFKKNSRNYSLVIWHYCSHILITIFIILLNICSRNKRQCTIKKK